MPKKVAIIGFGIEGQSALHYWQDQGAEITVCSNNANEQVPSTIATQLGPGYLHNLDRFDVIMRSAGIHPDILLRENPTIKPKITTVVNEFLRVCPTKNVIGITGTKGKGTTCTLTAKMLEAAGKKVFLGGNIGVSPFDFLAQVTPDSWVVLELSSFQLMDITHAPHIAMCLMVVPEHLNWHVDMPDYINAKSQLFAHQQPTDTAIYFADSPVSHQIVSNSPGKKITYYAPPGAYVDDDAIVIDNEEICQTSELKLLGKHNWQNACAAATAVWQVVKAPDAIRKVLTTFTGLEHRLEFVRELDGVKYYDDSFGTTPETAIVAMEALKEPKVVILGGADKGASYSGLAQAVKHANVRTAVIIGSTGAAIVAALKEVGFTSIVDGGTTMRAIVETARKAAQAGDVVLLSTGCASFGLFTDYKDRGNQFKQVVTQLL
ncbi:MAG TPA: UDP-N-acetylmuramoyl-L-alanine--D-glutamate ligase [Candidatus Saccharimonadales bacterium]|nr:UDP-N-acetylmuramoyl-L-alanine--D-glutamate ligase [Candidatus Saccharimonadales bacterium]